MEMKSIKWFTAFLLIATLGSCNKKYGNLAVRFHHFSANAPTLSWVYAGKDTVARISYLQSSDYVQASLENISFIAYAKNQALVKLSNPNWSENSRHSVFMCDTLGTINKVLLNDAHDAAPAGKALVRFLHLVPDTIGIVLLANGNEQFASQKFRYAFKNPTNGFSAFEPIDAGVYNFAFRTIIDSTAIDFTALSNATIENGKVYNLVATGLPNGTANFEMKLAIVAVD
jgi:hypothetical protein